MGEKEGKIEGGEKKKAEKGGEKKVEKKQDGGGAITVVLKVDMHCEGCAKKVKRSVKGFEGVETVTADSGNNKLTVVGKVDPWKLRERVEIKTHKQVTLISPTDYPKKKEESKKEEVKKEKKVEDPKPKPVSVVLKIRLHCDGCIQRIKRSIRKVKGVEEVSVDTLKELVTVKGMMDIKTMVPYLQDKFKRNVDIAPAAAKKDDGGEKAPAAAKKDDGGEKAVKKDDGGEKAVKKDDGGGDKKDKEKAKEKSIPASGDKGVGGGGEKKKDGGGGGEKKKDGGGEGEKKKDGGGEKEKDGGKKKDEVVGTTSKMEYHSGGYVPYEQPYYMQYPQTQQYQQHFQYQYQPHQQHPMPMPMPMPMQMPMVHQAPQMPTVAHSMFSDEDPNACSIM